MTIAATLGYPRIGPRREWKAALESYWAGTSDTAGLHAVGAMLRGNARATQRGAGIGHVASADFALYDHVLETALALGAVPDGYGWDGQGPASLTTLFALARGARGSAAEREAGIAPDAPALEMTKWFDTNYHYLVPRLSVDTRFRLVQNRWAEAVAEGLGENCRTRPVLLGPVSFLLLSKAEDGVSPLSLLPTLLPAYEAALRGIAEAGASWVQIDEPCLVTDLPAGAGEAYAMAFRRLADAAPGLRLLLATYFSGLRDNLPIAVGLPVDGLHLDVTRGRDGLDAVLDALPADRWLSLGLVDGRNVWRADLRAALATLHGVAGRRGTRHLMVAPSCSLLHVPHALAREDALDPRLKRRLAFAEEKLAEVAALARGLDEGEGAIAAALAESDRALAEWRGDPRIHDAGVAAAVAAVTPRMAQRVSAYPQRAAAQQRRLNLPPFPVTSIGSFPQTAEIRRARADHARGVLGSADYTARMETLTAEAIAWQEAEGVDVLVHGEFERNDMVKYFGEQLQGYAFTRHGWVQSYGSRCVAPPIIWGDVSRPEPMTLRWAQFAQSLSAKPVKGMLTGPVTMLHWAFVREDIPRREVCTQIALALREEVRDLEAAGIAVIQIDEPAFREGLPLRRTEQAAYLDWAAFCFRLSASVVGDATQIHTHMCYAEFNDIIGAIAAMDADVISVETARSQMELLRAFVDFDYPNAIGPGVWDIHSPRVPGAEEMVALLRQAARHLPRERLWVNPDCGCKTRGWAEVKPAMANLVTAARRLRAEAA